MNEVYRIISYPEVSIHILHTLKFFGTLLSVKILVQDIFKLKMRCIMELNKLLFYMIIIFQIINILPQQILYLNDIVNMSLFSTFIMCDHFFNFVKAK